MTVWTQTRLMILKENWQDKTDTQLAFQLGLKTSAVKHKMRQLHLVRPRKPTRPKPKAWTEKEVAKEVKKRKQEAERKKRLDLEKQMELNRRMREDKKFKTRQVNYSQQQSMRIDHKTIVYLKPGQDAEEVRRRYTRTLEKGGYTKIE